jgi:hypothetical protein
MDDVDMSSSAYRRERGELLESDSSAMEDTPKPKGVMWPSSA